MAKRTYAEIMEDTLNNFVNSKDFENKVRQIVREEVKTSEPTRSKTKTASKSKPKKSVEKDNRTWSEKKKAYGEEHFTEAERKAYGEQKRAERKAQKDAYEKTNKHFKGKKVDYKVWKSYYNSILTA